MTVYQCERLAAHLRKQAENEKQFAETGGPEYIVTSHLAASHILLGLARAYEFLGRDSH